MSKLIIFGSLLLCALTHAQAETQLDQKVKTDSGFVAAGHSSANLNAASEQLDSALNDNILVVEDDGSYTPLKENIVSIMAALKSSIGAAVNFELLFAENSYVLTADGKQTLGLVADSIRYLDSDIKIDIEMPAMPNQTSSLARQRGNEIVRLLRSRYNLKNPITFLVVTAQTAQSLRSNKRVPKRAQLQRVTVLNMGRV